MDGDRDAELPDVDPCQGRNIIRNPAMAQMRLHLAANRVDNFAEILQP